MAKTGSNQPCTCGSGKKFKKCCRDKKPRKQSIIIGSSEPLSGLQYDKDKMKFMGLTSDGCFIEPEATFSQTHYISQSGKEKVLSRVQDKVIPDEADLIRHLSSSFDLIIALDTNTKIIGDETVSASGIIHCVVKKTDSSNKYQVDFPQQKTMPFRNCPSELHPEKFGWMAEIQKINREPSNRGKKFAIVTDHDLDNHTLYNSKKIAIFKDFYLPENFKLIYGSDGSNENFLNTLVRKCDKESTALLKEIEEKGYCQNGDKKILINQIPVPTQ